MQTNIDTSRLGAAITRAASLQTYTTIRLLVDRPLVAAAYQAYAYFRWVDDWLDEPARQRTERLEFLARQTALVSACTRGERLANTSAEEDMLAALIDMDGDSGSGLHSYIQHMMAVMAFDSERRGRLISAKELDTYERCLARAVTEALHYFIGHGTYSPQGPGRALAAQGAHIAHMLRDAVEDNELGYFNIPSEYLRTNGITPLDTNSNAYRAWVRSRVQLARDHFAAGRDHLARVQSLRCRLAGYAYIARFETVLDSIERDGYVLRPAYRESKGPKAGAHMGWSVIASALNNRPAMAGTRAGITR